MRIILKSTDVAFLDRVEDMIRRGLSQSEMAAEVGIPLSTFRLKVRDLGFEIERTPQLRARPQFGGQAYEEMRGQIALADGAAGAVR